MQVTFQEAAFRLGLSEKTVRRRVLNGRLPGSQVATPQGFAWMVDIPDELPESGESFGELAALRELNTALQSRIDAQDKQLESKDKQIEQQLTSHQEELSAKNRQIEQLHVLLQQAQATLPAPRDNRPWWHRLWHRNGR
jgi:septin family protein